MKVWNVKLCVIGLCATLLPVIAQGQSTDLRGNGAFDTVSIAGFLIAIEDVERLAAADVLHRNPETNRFAFSARISSERRLKQALRDVPLQDARAVRDLYRSAKVALPNGVAHTLTTPSGYGPAVFSNQRGRVVLGMGMGGVSRVPYTSKADGGIGFGLSFGNSYETLGVRLSMSLNDLSEVFNKDRVSFGFEVSRYIADGFSVSLGGENLLVKETDGEESYYVVGSWAFDEDANLFGVNGVATLGLGSGRFAHKTNRDRFEGKGRDGTILFGALALEVRENVNLIVDWNGRNLSVGSAFRVPKTGVSVKLGVRDLTSNTGDGPRLTGAIGFTLARF